MEIKPNNLYLGDCYELIKDVADKSVDLVIIDPPYDMTSGGSGKSDVALRIKRFWNELDDSKLTIGMDFKLLNELERVLKHIYIYIWCNKILLFKLINYYSQREDVNLDLITWTKTNPMPACNNHFLNDIEYCLCVHEKGVGWNEKAGYEVKRKGYFLPVNQQDRKLFDFPCPKPKEIIRNFILNSSKEGDVILDTFAGSSTTLVCAKELGRKYIGFEINEKFYQIGIDRLNGITQKERKQNIEQMKLF